MPRKSEAWFRYQEEVAGFFRELDFGAETNVRLKGVRTAHDVDVVVRSTHVGLPLFWLIECKLWPSQAVPKAAVLAFRQIVDDLGAERGVLLSETGFQKGAFEAAAQSNVHLSSLADLKASAHSELTNRRLANLYERYGKAKEQYWDIPKYVRLAYFIMMESVRQGEYPGHATLQFADEVLSKAMRGSYPIHTALEGPVDVANASEVIQLLERLLGSLESRLEICLKDVSNWPKDEDEAYARVMASRGIQRSGSSP
jgi:restriction system protein